MPNPSQTHPQEKEKENGKNKLRGDISFSWDLLEG